MPQHTKGSLWLVLLWLSAIQVTTGFVPVARTNTHSRRRSLNLNLSEKTLKEDAATASTDTEADDDEPVGLNTKKQTLYDILDVSPDATRAELKRSYVAMARQTHPDALIGSDDKTSSTGLEFAEIAAAYRVLSDTKQRKRYDRSLAAEAFTDQVEQMAARVGKSAAPTAKRVIEKFAMPLFVRTATTTIASFSAAAEDLSKPNRTSVDLGSAVGAAFRAGRQAQRVIDRMDLLEKAEELESRAAVETEKAMAIKAELSELINKRLKVALRTPNSALSSAEALQIFDSLNTIDSVSLVDRVARFKHTLGFEIDTLEEAESDYYQTVNEHDEAKQHLFATQKAFVMAEQASKQAIEAEEQAKRAYEEAQRRVLASQQEWMELTKTLATADTQQTKTTADLERCSLALERRQEKVRKALRQKEEELSQKKKAQIKNNKSLSDTSTNTAEEATTTTVQNGGGDLAELKRLRQEEQLLTAESELVEEKANRLLSRAKKLKERCEELDK